MTNEAERLRAEIDALRAENEGLRTAAAAEDAPRPPTRRWRAWLSATCIVLAALLVPLSVVGAWTRAQLVDEQRFVATFAPLASDPDVQSLVVDAVGSAVDEQIDIAGLTDDLFDGIASLDLPPAAQRALGLLRAPAAAGARALVADVVTQVVQSDAFGSAWEQSLVATHRALAAAATGGSDGAVALDDGELGIRLGPIVARVRSVLIDRSFALAAAIPEVDATIVLAQSDALKVVVPAYTLAVTVGYALPFVALGLLVAGVLVARRRSTAALGSGIALVLGAGATAIALRVGGILVGVQAGSLGVPAATAQDVYDTVVARMRDTSVVLVLLGVVVAVAAWLGGRWASAARVRGFAASLPRGARRGLQRRGLATGSFGRWLHEQRLLVRILLLVVAIAVLAIAPLTLGALVATVTATLLVWLALELLSRHPGDAETDADADDARPVDAATPAP